LEQPEKTTERLSELPKYLPCIVAVAECPKIWGSWQDLAISVDGTFAVHPISELSGIAI
jgi:hypothetical protein